LFLHFVVMLKETTAIRRIWAVCREGRTYVLPRTDEPRGCLCGCVPSWMKLPRVEKKTRSVDRQINHASAVQDATCTGISDVGQPEESRSGVKERTLTDLIGVRFVGDSLCDSGFGLSDDQASRAITLSNASVEESGDGVRERALTEAISSGRPARDSDFGLSDAQATRATTLAEAAPEESRGTFFRSMTASSEIERLSFDSDFGLSDGQLMTCTGLTDVVKELSLSPEPNANGAVVDVPERRDSKSMFTMVNVDVTVEALNDVSRRDEFLWGRKYGFVASQKYVAAPRQNEPASEMEQGAAQEIIEAGESMDMFTKVNLDVTVTAVNDIPTLDEFLWEGTNAHQQLDTTSRDEQQHERVDDTLLDQEVGTPSTQSFASGTSLRSEIADAPKTWCSTTANAPQPLSAIGEDPRYDFGPGIMTKCRACGRFTRNRGDKETKTVYCQSCFSKPWTTRVNSKPLE
jgi:hypothetical protein